ncbi:MAG: MarR family winged helix-turn-helix transcriptional regulator [Acidimicrobiia bacterium]
MSATKSSPTADEALTAMAEALRLSVGRLSRQMRRETIGDLTASQFSALAAVSVHGPLRLADLVAIEGVSAPTLTKIVAALEALELVKRTPDADDRRSARIAITAYGRKQLERMRSRRTAFLARRIERLGDADRERLAAALDALRQLAQDPA